MIRKDSARKAFERAIKDALPASYTQLQRALEREARAYRKRVDEIDAAARADRDRAGAEDQEAGDEPAGEVDEDLDAEDVEGEQPS